MHNYELMIIAFLTGVALYLVGKWFDMAERRNEKRAQKKSQD